MRKSFGIVAAVLFAANTALALPAVQISDLGSNRVVWDSAKRPDGNVVVVGFESTGPDDYRGKVWTVSPNGDTSEVPLPGLFEGARTGGFSLSANGLVAGGFSDRSATEFGVPVIWDLTDVDAISAPTDLGTIATSRADFAVGYVSGLTDNGLKAVGNTAGGSNGFEWDDSSGWAYIQPALGGVATATAYAASSDLLVAVGSDVVDAFTGRAICTRESITEVLAQDPYTLTYAFSISPDGQVIGSYSTYWDLPTGGASVQNTVFDKDGNFLDGYFYGATNSKLLVGGQNLFLNYEFVTNRNGAIIAYPGFDQNQPGVVVGGNFSQWLRETYGAGVADANGTDDDVSTILGIYETADEAGFAAVTFDDGPSGKVGHSYLIRIIDEPSEPVLVPTDITVDVNITRTDAVTSSATQTNVPVRLSIRLFGRTFNIDFSAPVVSGVTVTNDAFVSVENTSAGTVTAPINLAVTPGDPEVTGGGTQVLQTDGAFEVGQGLGGGVTLTKTAAYDLSSYLGRRLTLAEYAALVQTTSQWASQQRQTVGQYDVAVTGLLPVGG